jgi:hypothetical protein
MGVTSGGYEGASEPRTLLDDLVPKYDVSSRHTIWVAASPAVVYETARHVDLGHPWLVRLLMGIRVLPAWLAAVLRGPRRARNKPGERPVGAAPFTVVAESPGEEFVLGIMGRFWTPTGGVVAARSSRRRRGCAAAMRSRGGNSGATGGSSGWGAA